MALKTEFVDPWGHVDRMKAAQAIANTKGAIVREAEFQFSVKSQSNESEYRIDLVALTCTCRDFTFRGQCKHLVAVAIHVWGEERARFLLESLKRLKFERDLAVSQIRRCQECGGQTKLLELVKLPLPVQAVEVYNARVKCETCQTIYTVSVPTKRRAEAS